MDNEFFMNMSMKEFLKNGLLLQNL